MQMKESTQNVVLGSVLTAVGAVGAGIAVNEHRTRREERMLRNLRSGKKGKKRKKKSQSKLKGFLNKTWFYGGPQKVEIEAPSKEDLRDLSNDELEAIYIETMESFDKDIKRRVRNKRRMEERAQDLGLRRPLDISEQIREGLREGFASFAQEMKGQQNFQNKQEELTKKQKQQARHADAAPGTVDSGMEEVLLEIKSMNRNMEALIESSKVTNEAILSALSSD